MFYQRKFVFVWANTYNYFPLVWARNHCESKIKKQNLQAAES